MIRKPKFRKQKKILPIKYKYRVWFKFKCKKYKFEIHFLFYLRKLHKVLESKLKKYYQNGKITMTR